MRLITLITTSLIILMSPVAHAEDSYLCVTEKVTGFVYDRASGNWSSTNFNDERQYIVSRSRAQGVAWQVAQVGEVIPSTLCRSDFTHSGNLSCEGPHQFKMNKANRRFLHAYLMGYWSDHSSETRAMENPFLFKEGENTPFVEIGTCRPL